MKHPLQDVVVVLPGIMGSALADESGHEVWGTSLGTLAKGVLTGARAIKRLQLPPGIGDAAAPDGVVATHLLDDIHVIPGIWSVTIGYDRQMQWFRDTFDVVEAGDTVTRSQPRRLSVRLAPVEPGERAGPQGVRRADARALPRRARPRRRQGRVRRPLDGRPRGPLLHRRARRPRDHAQGDHPRHAAPRRGERARLAGQRGVEGVGAGEGRSDRAGAQPAGTVRAAARVRVHRERRRSAQDHRGDGSRARHHDDRRGDAVPRRAAQRRRGPRQRLRRAPHPRPHPADLDHGAHQRRPRDARAHLRGPRRRRRRHGAAPVGVAVRGRAVESDAALRDGQARRSPGEPTRVRRARGGAHRQRHRRPPGRARRRCGVRRRHDRRRGPRGGDHHRPRRGGRRGGDRRCRGRPAAIDRRGPRRRRVPRQPRRAGTGRPPRAGVGSRRGRRGHHAGGGAAAGGAA